jgi:hypothetical protein
VRRVLVVCCVLVCARAAGRADTPAPVLVALAPAPSDDDARRAVALGPAGEVYEPDGKGAWVRTKPIATADALQGAGRAGAAVVALADGVVYKLSENGWSALRLVQRGKAILGDGTHAVAAVGKQLFAIDRPVNGEPQKLGVAPADVLALGAGAKAVIVATPRGLVRIEGTKTTTLAWAPRTVQRLVGDAWAIVDRGALDLRTNKLVAWPAGVGVGAASPVALAGDGALVAVATVRGNPLELVIVRGGKLERDPIAITPPAIAPVGVAVDRANRAVVALRDGRVAVRERGAWTAVTVSEQLPAAKPGAGPAPSR